MMSALLIYTDLLTLCDISRCRYGAGPVRLLHGIPWNTHSARAHATAHARSSAGVKIPGGSPARGESAVSWPPVSSTGMHGCTFSSKSIGGGGQMVKSAQDTFRILIKSNFSSDLTFFLAIIRGGVGPPQRDIKLRPSGMYVCKYVPTDRSHR